MSDIYLSIESIPADSGLLSDEDMSRARRVRRLQEMSDAAGYGNEIDRFLLDGKGKVRHDEMSAAVGAHAVAHCPTPNPADHRGSAGEKKRKSLLSLPFLKRQLMSSNS